jgi:uncharacterized protein (TIGR04255 family)
MSARHQYKNAPIAEALVEFRFTPGAEWDLTIPGKLHQHPAIKDEYPGKPRTQNVLQAIVQANVGQAPNFNLQQGVGGIQLVDADAKRILALAPNALSVHVLRPYEGWEKFRPRMDAALTAYREVAGVDSVVRIGLRYVNQVQIPLKQIRIEDYFTCAPQTPAGLPDLMASFMTRTEHVFEDKGKLILTFASLDWTASAPACTFLLDLDAIWEGPGTPVAGAMSIVDVLKERVGSAFEKLITQKLREVFDA